jgi:hypothetical protein
MNIEGIPLPEKSHDLRSLGSAITKAIEEYIGGESAENWSIIIKEVDPARLKDKKGVRSSIRDKPREIILVLERGNITLISKKFTVEICNECGFGKV